MSGSGSEFLTNFSLEPHARARSVRTAQYPSAKAQVVARLQTGDLVDTDLKAHCQSDAFETRKVCDRDGDRQPGRCPYLQWPGHNARVP
jgi:hypothetical protein